MGVGGVKKRQGHIVPYFLLAGILLFPVSPLRAQTIFQQVGVASSPNPVGSGARAMGMGGAFIAIADDATAASWNPGGLIQLERPEISVVGDYYSREEDFSSSADSGIKNSGEVDEFNLNYLSAVYPFKLLDRNMVVSLNFQRLLDFKRRFNFRQTDTLDFLSGPVELVQDKSFDQDGFVGALGLAAAFQVTPNLSVGAMLNIWTDDLFWDNGWDETFTERGATNVGGVPVAIDTFRKDRYSDFTGLNVNLGGLWNVNEYLTIGAVVKTPFEASLHHEFSFHTTETSGGTTRTNETRLTEDVELDMPLSYGGGIALRLSDRLSFAFDVYRTHWSDYILTDGGGNKFSPIDGRPKGDSDVKGTMQARLGGEYLFIGKTIVVPVRGGVFYDPEPSEGSVKDFYGVAIGSGLTHKTFSIDAAYQFRWARDVDTGNLVTNSGADIDQHLIFASAIYYF